MLAISDQKNEANCSPSILPCRIHHNGQVNASSRHWDPQSDADGAKTAYFRGRKLHGRTVKLPQGYRGVVVEKSDRVLPQSTRKQSPPGEDEEEEDIQPEVKLLEHIASFDRFTVWAHEATPKNADDTHIKGMEEWLAFADAMNSYDDGEVIRQ